MIYSWKKIVRYGIPLLTFCVCIEIVVGQLLQYGETVLIRQLPIFLISIPVINGIGGNVGSILGAHLASGLHIGSITLDVHDKEMHHLVITALFMGVLTYVLIAIIIYWTGMFNGLQMNIALLPFVFVITATGCLLICLLSLISVITAFISFRKGIDPDDVVSPVVTTFGDTLGIIFLFVFVGAVIL